MPREIAYNWVGRAVGLSSEEALFVLRLQANEDAAYDELVRTYSASIYHVAYRMLGSVSEADDALQEAWLRIRGQDTAGVENMQAWLTTVVGRVCLNMLRSRRARRDALACAGIRCRRHTVCVRSGAGTSAFLGGRACRNDRRRELFDGQRL